MPKVITHVKHTPQVEFKKQLKRDPKLLQGPSMGETCYDHKLMDRVKPTVKGIQHFSKSHTDRVVFTGKYGCGPADTVNDNPDNAHTQELLELQMYKYMRDNMKYKKDEDE
jgi:hypothetical protein